MKIDLNEMITGLFENIERTRAEKVTAGSKFRLMGLVADVTEINEEYARLYEQEKRRYLGSKTAKSARKTFDEWKEDQCYGMPSLEDIDDYLLEKLLHMFEKGVFNARVEHIQRTTRYPGEFDFEQLDDDHQLKKTVYKHYAALRKWLTMSMVA